MPKVAVDSILDTNHIIKIMQNDLSLFQSISRKLLEQEVVDPVLKPVEPSRLHDLLDIDLNDEPVDQSRFDKALSDLVLNTPRTSTNMFFNQLFGGRQGKAVVGELLSVMLNSSMYTYKVGGPMIAIEKEILDKIAEKIGYAEDYGGTIAPGGSMTNMMAMIMARDKMVPDVRFKGLSSTMTLYTSKESHYSIPKNASFIGIGRDQIRFIPTDDKGQMDSKALKMAVESDLSAGHQPFFVNATAGTTVLGVFDPLEQIAEICESYGIWMHVDGALGGSVLFSSKYRHLIKGIERSDSFSLNAHKTLGVPLACSMIWAKNKQDLYESFSNEASYLYQTANDDLNPGKISLQCGRRNDALKFWCLWKSIGTKGLENAVDHQYELAQFARNYVRQHADYELYNHDESISICFNYKGIPAEEICNRLYEEGEIMVGFGRFREDVFIRLVTVNFGLEKANILQFFKHMEDCVEKYIL